MQDKKDLKRKGIKILWMLLKVFVSLILPLFIIYYAEQSWSIQKVRPKAYCNYAESDAQNIAATISDYFANPLHTTLPTISGDSVYLGFTLSAKGGQNIAWVSGDPMDRITIVVQDTSGKCPSKYRTSSARSTMQDKWSSTGNLYTIIMD